MRISNTLFSVVVIGLLALHSQAQVSFTNKTDILQNPNSFTSGVAVAVADMNADGLDDIVRLDNGFMLSIEYQQPGGGPFSNFSYGDVFIGNEDAWAIIVGDINNDGLNDVLTGGYYTGMNLLTATNGGTDFSPTILPENDIFVQGSNLADVNNDGWLDVFACHDDGPSRLWLNDGTGVFPAEANNSVINFDITPGGGPSQDDSGNYGSVWTDFDNDRDLDLYIAKCRQGVGNPADPRRTNILFVNDGQNNYAEAGEAHGLRIGWQSWTAEFQDIDNDGDMDCFVTNHDYRVQLLENDGTGYFTDITEQAGINLSGNKDFNQGLMRDFDNDGFVDIITAQPAYLFHNNGDKTFTQMPSPFSGSFGSLAVGDLNHDGFLDIYAAYQNGYNSPSNEPDKLWINDTNDNHFMAIQLKGVQSNRSGVGARVEIHGSWGIQIREVRAGESYGISNTLTAHFGLGQDSVVEYVVVRWPSGTVDVVANPAADQFLSIEEGSTCIVGIFAIDYEGPPVLCPNQSVTMMAPDGLVYLWNNGAVSQTLNVDQPGNYSLVAVDGNGCAMVSDVVKVIEAPDETPTVNIVGDTLFCEGGSVDLIASFAASYTWSNGQDSPIIMVEQTGDYFVTVPTMCGSASSLPVHVEALPKAGVPQTEDVTIIGPAAATLTATGNHLYWYDSPDAEEALATGPVFETHVLDTTTTYYVEDANEYGGGNYSVGMVEHAGTLYSGSAATNGQIIFDVFEQMVLKQVKVQTDYPGIRRIELWDANGVVLQGVDVNIQAGVSYVEVGFTIEPGSGYILTTNEAVNNQSLGVDGPRLVRSNQGVVYPYTVDNVVSITDSDLGDSYYYYFFDWQIEVLPIVCAGERVPVTVHVEPNAVAEALPFGDISVSPNPSNGSFQLMLEPLASGQATLRMLDLTGKQVFQEQWAVTAGLVQSKSIILSGCPAGMYFLQMVSGERVSSLKLVLE